MQTELKVKLFGNDVAAVVWDKTSGHAVFEYYKSFPGRNLDIAPIMMPMSDALRGSRVYSFAGLKGNTNFNSEIVQKTILNLDWLMPLLHENNPMRRS